MPPEASQPQAVRGSARGPVLHTLQSAGPPGPTPQVTVDGIEVVQVVQDLAHSVTLVAGKRTVARVYLSTDGSSPVTVRGTLGARRAGAGGWTQIPSVSDVILNPAITGAGGLRQKRESLGLSLNFLLPLGLLSVGDLELELASIEKVNPVAALPLPTGGSRRVTFSQAVPLRVCVIGIRYEVPSGGGSTREFEPAAIDYSLTRSWLGRAYPVAVVEWTQTVVDWPGTRAWPTSDTALETWGRDFVNPYLAAVRAQDVAAGTDHRTHYYGLAADGGGFMRGWALTPVSTPDPAAVGCGPAGRPAGSFGWDTDGSYADWYTAHELAHTFGREHPGFCNNNSRDDDQYPHDNGQIGDDDAEFVGYDAGDADHAIPPRALPGAVWHDLMTYCERQWLSDYTYLGIYRRLVAEDAIPAPGPSSGVPAPSGGRPTPPNPAVAGGGAMSGLPGGIHVVARVNQTKATGQFRFVTPVNLPASAGPDPNAGTPFSIRVRRANDPPVEHTVLFRKDTCGDPGEKDVTGTVDVVIPNDPAATALDLVYRDAVLDTFTPGAEPPEPQNIRSAAGGSQPASNPTATAPGAQPGPTTARASASPTGRPRVAWSTGGGAAGPAMHSAPANGSGSVYTVQMSTDAGQSWRTVGVGLSSPEVSLDPSLLAGADTVQIRVTATNGFKTKSTTQSLPVKDL